MYSALRSENRPIPVIPTVTAVLFQPEDDHLHRLALRYAMQHINLKQELQRGTELYMVELNMLQEDSLRTGELGREC